MNTITNKAEVSKISQAIELIEKLNSRAAKKGYPNVINYTLGEIEFVEVKEKGLNGKIIKTLEKHQEITIENRLPLISGWKIIGKIDYTLGSDKGIVKAFEEVPEHFRSNCTCDHCGVKRQRNETFILKNESGEFKNIGSSCIEDFINIQVEVLNVYFSDINLDEYSGSGITYYSVKEVLAATNRIANAYGYVSGKKAAEMDISPTSATVMEYINNGKDLIRDIGYLESVDFEMAAKIMNHINEKEAINDYLINLKTLIAAEAITWKHINYVVSAYGLYLSDMNKANEKEGYTVGFLGNVKDKIEFTAKIELIKSYSTQYGVSTMVKMRSDSGHAVIWFATGIPDFQINEVLKFKATIKNTEVYKDMDQTIITRAKVI